MCWTHKWKEKKETEKNFLIELEILLEILHLN